MELASFQTVTALSLVALTLFLFVRNWWHKRHQQGCSGGCGCIPPDKLILKKKSK